MDEEDFEPRNQKPEKPDLSSWSIEELNDYIAEMEDEIERVRGVIAGKQSHREGVEGLFKS